MSATNVSIRLGVEGKAEVKRAFEDVSPAGGQAFGQVDRALEKTGAATDRETSRFKSLAEAARMAAHADTTQGRFNQVLGVDRQAAVSVRASAEVFAQAAREAERYKARARALRATLDPLAAANAPAKSCFDQTAQAIKGVGANSKLMAKQVMMLQYTVHDVIASMSTGMSPMTILMQQGGQVTQAFGGLRGTIMMLGSAIGVVGGVIAGVAVSVGVLAAALFANDASTRAVSTALAGVGRASGATAAQLEQVAQSSADAGKASVSSARDLQAALLRTAKIGTEEMAEVTAFFRASNGRAFGFRFRDWRDFEATDQQCSATCCYQASAWRSEGPLALIDGQLFGDGARKNVVTGPRLQDLRVQSSGYGWVIPRVCTKARLSGNVIWMRDFDEETRTQTQTVGGGGKGGGGRQTTTTVTYVCFCEVAVALCEGPITGIGKMFVDGYAIGSEHYAARRVYPGDATQSADLLIAATEGLALAHRGLGRVRHRYRDRAQGGSWFGDTADGDQRQNRHQALGLPRLDRQPEARAAERRMDQLRLRLVRHVH